jgi:predicted nucleic acid-binding protein
MNRIVADTNILVYAVDRCSRFHQRSLDFLTRHAGIYLPGKVLVEFYAVVTRAAIRPLSPAEALNAIAWFARSFPILHANSDSQRILWDLAQRYNPSGLRIHDFEIASIALAHRIERLATFNARDFASVRELQITDLQL